LTALPVDVHDAVVRLSGCRITRVTSVAGGDINRACVVTLTDRRKLFVKFNPEAPPDLFQAESEGLSWLSEPGVMRTPSVVAYSNTPPVLLLEYVDRGRPGKDYAETLGRSLAHLHMSGAPSFGFLPNNYIGTLPQDNAAETTFAEFWWRRRLEPQIRLALNSKLLPLEWLPRFGVLETRLPSLLTEPTRPERIHGDLWSGNVMCDADGAPVLVDPAAYGGHGEVDLAMMRLFGGFAQNVESAYLEVNPAEPGLSERVRLLQLYPLLVHANLFGSAYVHQMAAVFERFT
jgi:fructosamine-3-kinase